jgi:copper chaperone CopZ
MPRMQEVVLELGAIAPQAAEVLQAALAAVPGVLRVELSRSEGHAIVTADTLVATPDALREAAASAGCDVQDLRYPE